MLQMAPMRRLIRSKQTGKLLQRNGEWTDNPSAAENFLTTVDAARACKTYRLHDVELVMQFNDERFDVALPLE